VFKSNKQWICSYIKLIHVQNNCIETDLVVSSGEFLLTPGKITPVLLHWLAPSFLFLLDIKCVYIGRNGEGSVKVVGCRVERTKMAKYLKSFFVHFIGNPWVWVWFSVWVRAI